MDWLQSSLLVIVALSAGLMLLGTACHRPRLLWPDQLTEANENHRKRLGDGTDPLNKLEIRLHDYGREVEARIENRLSVLDQLILEADQEISRLENLLAPSRNNWQPEKELTPAEQQRCFAMLEAGFSTSEIATCLKTNVAQVEQSLDEWRRPDRHAA